MNIALVQIRYTMAIGSPEFMQISIAGPIRRCMKPGALSACTGLCGFCTDSGFTLLGSPNSAGLLVVQKDSKLSKHIELT